MSIQIRKLNPNDREQWEILWKGYQEFYETNLDSVTESTWERLLNESDPYDPICLVAEEDGKLLGLTHYLFHGTTWSPKQRIYLNDLYTVPESRGKGVGQMLIEAVYEAGKASDCEAVYWLTQDFNTTARGLYDKVADLTPFVKYSKYM